MICQSTGRPPISTSGLGLTTVSSLSRVPRTPAKIMACIEHWLLPYHSPHFCLLLDDLVNLRGNVLPTISLNNSFDEVSETKHLKHSLSDPYHHFCSNDNPAADAMISFTHLSKVCMVRR